MKRFHVSSKHLLMGPIIVVSTLWLASCARTGSQLASNEPSVCGGDFGMLEQMEYEFRGNAKPVGPEVYEHC